MGTYRIVGTFRAANEAEKKASAGRSQFVSLNKKRSVVSGVKPVDISSALAKHQPINTFSRYSENRGMMFGQITLEAGDIWPTWDGQRLIIEASARRIIFYQHGGAGTNRIYIQNPTHFINNVTTDTFNHKSAEKTSLVKRLAEWEIHFLTGFLGAAHWVGMITVFGLDIFEQAIGERKRNADYKKAVSDIIDADNELKSNCPVLRSKVIEALLAGAKSKPGEKALIFTKSLPELIIKDDKTTGRIAGAIAAKFIVNPKNNNLVFWFILQTIALQVGTKSAGKIPPALGAAFKQSFERLLPDINNIDTSTVAGQQAISKHLIDTMRELGVEVSPAEAKTIIGEIQRNPERIASSFIKLGNAFEQLASAGEN